jgi:hypothetical protein
MTRMSKRTQSQHGKSGIASRTKAKKAGSLTGDELQGRAGHALPAHERTVLGREQEWERANDEANSSMTAAVRSAHGSNVSEMEYERGPGSKFDIEGRGVARSKRQRVRRSK